jgi:hypothetical protein
VLTNSDESAAERGADQSKQKSYLHEQEQQRKNVSCKDDKT